MIKTAEAYNILKNSKRTVLHSWQYTKRKTYVYTHNIELPLLRVYTGLYLASLQGLPSEGHGYIFSLSQDCLPLDSGSIPASGGSPGVTVYQEHRRGVLVSRKDEAPWPV